jgi:hypothetical protein
MYCPCAGDQFPNDFVWLAAATLTWPPLRRSPWPRRAQRSRSRSHRSATSSRASAGCEASRGRAHWHLPRRRAWSCSRAQCRRAPLTSWSASRTCGWCSFSTTTSSRAIASSAQGTRTTVPRLRHQSCTPCLSSLSHCSYACADLALRVLLRVLAAEERLEFFPLARRTDRTRSARL